MLPKGWCLVEAQEICNSISVGVVIKPSQYYVSESEGVKAFRSANVREGYINDSDWVYFSKEGHEINKKSQLKTGDVLIVRTGYPGTACVVTPEFEGTNAIDIVIARPDKNQVVSEYLCDYTNSHIGKSQVLNLQGGMAQKHLNVGAYQVLKIKLPPLSEQKKIAKILSTWDQAIATTERLLDLARQQKKALMQQLLTGKKRFPGFEGEWKTYVLSNLFDFKKGKGLSKDALCEVGSKCVLYGELYTKYGEVITSIVSRTKENDGLPSKAGDILIPSSTTTTGIDLANATAILEDGVLLGGDINVLRPKKKMNTVFMAHLLTHIKKNDIASRAQGITIIHLYSSDLKTISVHIPDEVEEQNKISSVLSNSQSEIDYLISQLDSLKQEKKALMQALLTGKRRVLA